MSLSIEQLREQVQGWTAPISADAPGGSSAKADPSYDRLVTEVSKLESPTGGAVNWQLVAQDGGQLLKEKSKDLLIASYFSYGLFATQGLKGLLTGIGVLHELLDGYWDSCFPEKARIRGRVNALSWFIQRAAIGLGQQEVTAADAPHLDSLTTAASALAATVRVRFEAQAPAMAPLLEGLTRLKLNLPEVPAPKPEAPAAAPAPVPAAAAAPAPVATAPPAATPAPPAAAPAPVAISEPIPAAGDLGAPGAGTEHLARLGAAIASTARAMRQAQPQDPTAYRVLRTGLWLHLVQAPPGGPDGKTSVPAPAANLRERVEKLLSNAKWVELLDEAESGLSQNRLWLDLHHYSARALEALGFTSAKEALILELASLLKRMPALRTLQYTDGSPFADAGTRAWIDAEVLPKAAPSLRTSAPAGSEGRDDPLEEAHALMAQGKKQEATLRLEAAVSGAVSERERFRARLALAQLCASTAQKPLARALFQRLDAEGLERGLDVWEPGLAAQVLEGLIASLESGGSATGALAQELESLQVRLFFINPSAALRLGS